MHFMTLGKHLNLFSAILQPPRRLNVPRITLRAQLSPLRAVPSGFVPDTVSITSHWNTAISASVMMGQRTSTYDRYTPSKKWPIRPVACCTVSSVPRRMQLWSASRNENSMHQPTKFQQNQQRKAELLAIQEGPFFSGRSCSPIF